MKVCIAEKPSVAKDIAEIIGAKKRMDGYYEGNGYQVTWTFGHFCTLKEPHDYHDYWKSWRLEDLPIIPSNFGIKLIDNPGVKKQFATIQQLIQGCEEVINCGDAGQEGELIQRWVLLKAKNKVPVKRLWISSLTEKAIKDGFQHLKESQNFDRLYAAGSARAIGDWLLGMNATRLFTKKYAQGKAVLSIGRVQTPTLAMIVQRTKEFESFVSEEYWELKTIYRDTEFTATIDRLKSLEKAEKGIEYLKNFPFVVTDFERKEGKEGQPKLFDLTGLQVEANKKYGYSAEDTLKLIQGLYEKKLVTYPRVDTTYLSEDLHPQIPDIMQGLVYYKEYTASILSGPIPKHKHIFDDTKVTDHHAIIPTGIVPSANLHLDDKRIYDMVARRFIAAFYPECKVANTTVLGEVGKIGFKATGKQILEPGWRVLYKNDETEKKDKEPEVVLPHFEIGEMGPHEPKIHHGKTSPPKLYTEATLLRAMETAGKQTDDEELRDLLKLNGIGRPSTRANIIETLYKRKYIEKRRKNIIATPTGIQLIDSIQVELLKSVELTGQWERKLRMIDRGEYELETFKQELIEMVSQLVQDVKNSAYRPIAIQSASPVSPSAPKKERAPRVSKTKLEDLVCPKCQQGQIIKGKIAFGCKNFKVCDFKIPFELYQMTIKENHIVDLLTKSKTSISIKKEDGSSMRKTILLTSDMNVEIQ